MVLAEIAGPLDVDQTPSLLDQLLPLCRSSRRVVLDLRRAEFIDSTGVRGLLSLQKAIADAGGQFRLVTTRNSQVRRILKLLAIDCRFAMFESGIDAWITRWDDVPHE